jgi:hypothetical protein
MTEKRNDSGRKSGLSEAPPHYHGHRERLRARFREAGSEAVSDYELLELVLFRAIPQRDIKPLAKDLIARFGSFAEVVAAPAARLAEIKGMGEAAITELKVVHAAATPSRRRRERDAQHDRRRYPPRSQACRKIPEARISDRRRRTRDRPLGLDCQTDANPCDSGMDGSAMAKWKAYEIQDRLLSNYGAR